MSPAAPPPPPCPRSVHLRPLALAGRAVGVTLSSLVLLGPGVCFPVSRPLCLPLLRSRVASESSWGFAYGPHCSHPVPRRPMGHTLRTRFKHPLALVPFSLRLTQCVKTHSFCTAALTALHKTSAPTPGFISYVELLEAWRSLFKMQGIVQM